MSTSAQELQERAAFLPWYRTTVDTPTYWEAVIVSPIRCPTCRMALGPDEWIWRNPQEERPARCNYCPPPQPEQLTMNLSGWSQGTLDLGGAA